jgi:hypothetical protein
LRAVPKFFRFGCTTLHCGSFAPPDSAPLHRFAPLAGVAGEAGLVGAPNRVVRRDVCTPSRKVTIVSSAAGALGRPP